MQKFIEEIVLKTTKNAKPVKSTKYKNFIDYLEDEKSYSNF